MVERHGVRSKLNAGAGEEGGGGEPTCVCNNHIHDDTSVALGGFTKYVPVDIPSDVHWSVLAYHSEYAEFTYTRTCTKVTLSMQQDSRGVNSIASIVYTYNFRSRSFKSLWSLNHSFSPKIRTQ